MKLTNMRSRTVDGVTELEVELDGVHYEAEKFLPGTEAVDLVARLHRLAARIEARSRPQNPQPRMTAGEVLRRQWPGEEVPDA